MKNYMDGGRSDPGSVPQTEGRLHSVVARIGMVGRSGRRWCIAKRSGNRQGPGYIDCWHENPRVQTWRPGYTLITRAGRRPVLVPCRTSGCCRAAWACMGALQSEVADDRHVRRIADRRRGPDLDIEQQWYGRLERRRHRTVRSTAHHQVGAPRQPALISLYEQVIRAGEMAAAHRRRARIYLDVAPRAHAARLDAARA